MDTMEPFDVLLLRQAAEGKPFCVGRSFAAFQQLVHRLFSLVDLGYLVITPARIEKNRRTVELGYVSATPRITGRGLAAVVERYPEWQQRTAI